MSQALNRSQLPHRNKHARAFLAAYKLSANITAAAAAAGIERQLHYRWLKSDAAYATAFEAADEEATGALIDLATHRATVGVFEPTVYQGEFTFPVVEVVDAEGEVTWQRASVPLGVYKPSDALMMFLLKARRPAQFRETWKGELSGPGGGPIPLDTARLALLSNDELSALIATARILAAPVGDDRGSGT